MTCEERLKRDVINNSKRNNLETIYSHFSCHANVLPPFYYSFYHSSITDQLYGKYCRFSEFKVFDSDNFNICFCSWNAISYSHLIVSNWTLQPFYGGSIEIACTVYTVQSLWVRLTIIFLFRRFMETTVR